MELLIIMMKSVITIIVATKACPVNVVNNNMQGLRAWERGYPYYDPEPQDTCAEESILL